MNLTEAIQSGRRFRRPGMIGWFDGPGVGSIRATMAWTDMTASEWEVEEKAVTITKTQFIKAIYSCCARGIESVDDIAKELGL